MRTSLPLVPNISLIPNICLLLYRSYHPLPLKNIANKVTREKDILKLIKDFFNSLKIYPDMLSLMTDMKLISDRDMTRSDMNAVFPGLNYPISEIYREFQKIKVQYLTDLGRSIAYAQERDEENKVKNLIFLSLMASENLPFFKNIIQNRSIINKEVDLNYLRQDMNMKRPDAKHILEWCRWLKINISASSDRFILDRYEIIYKLVDSLCYFLNKRIEENNLFGEPIYFYQVRSDISKMLGLNENFLGFDEMFKIIFESNKDKISFAPARDALLEGRGFEGSTRLSIMVIDSNLRCPSREESIQQSDIKALLVREV